MANKQEFWQSACANNYTFMQYYNRFVEIATSMFEWKNLPDEIDPRYLELCLFTDGNCVFFKDEVLGYTALRCAVGGQFNVYRVPMYRRAYAENGYSKELTDKDSVLIYNNYLRTPSLLDIENFARRLYNIDRAIDVNTNAQKTPILITCEENQLLTMKNTYLKYDGNQPVILASKSFDPNALKVLQTGAPFVAPQLYELKMNIYHECLEYLGIDTTIQKGERMLVDEIQKNSGATMANRYSRLEARRQAANQINRMFGLNISVDYRSTQPEDSLGKELEPDGELHD